MRTVGPGHPSLILVRDAATGKLETAGETYDARQVASTRDIGGDLLLLPHTEITHRQLIEACALSGIVTAVCTRGATLKEITRAAGWYQLAFRVGCVAAPAGGIGLVEGGRLILVHGGDNLRALERIAGQTHAPVGYEGPHAVLAVAAGAVLLVVDGQEDAAHVRAGEAAMGNGQLPRAADVRGRRVIVAARELHAGDTLAPGDVQFEAGHEGMAPWQVEQVVGRRLLQPIARGQPLTPEALDGLEPEPPPWFTPGPPPRKT